MVIVQYYYFVHLLPKVGTSPILDFPRSGSELFNLVAHHSHLMGTILPFVIVFHLIVDLSLVYDELLASVLE